MEQLFTKAVVARRHAHAPYSKFRVGASILLKNGKYITGANIENVSFGLSMCAERVALYGAYSKGYTKEDIVALLVVADTEAPTSSCGACRQVMMELMDSSALVIFSNLKGEKKEYKVKDLLPDAFEVLM